MCDRCVCKICEFKGKREDLQVMFGNAQGSFTIGISLRAIKHYAVVFGWEPAVFNVQQGTTSLQAQAGSWSIGNPFKINSQNPGLYRFPFEYSTNGATPITNGTGYLTVVAPGQTPVFVFPTIPADATQMTLYGGSATWIMKKC